MLDPSTEVASGFTVAKYLAIRSRLDPTMPMTPEWEEVRDVFRRRIDARFIEPIKRLLETRPSKRSVPGFAILALDCLLIDTLQSFREGRISTGETSSSKSFGRFLASNRFSSFSKNDKREFVHYVRNGLLHNGETRGDWRVRTSEPEMIKRAPSGSRILNRTLFHNAVVAEIEEYQTKLATGPSSIRSNFLRRMDSICGLSVQKETFYFAYGSNLVADELRRTAPDAQPEGVGFVPGWRLVFTKHSSTRDGDAASIEPCVSHMLWGFVYRLNQSDKTELKRREGGYREIEVTALLVDDVNDCSNAKPIEAFTFVAAKNCSKRCGPPTAYLELVRQGAVARGLPESYIDELSP